MLQSALPALAELQARPAPDDDEWNEQMDRLDRGNQVNDLLAWAEQTLNCAPVPCACTGTSGPCLRCRVASVVFGRQWEMNRE